MASSNHRRMIAAGLLLTAALLHGHYCEWEFSSDPSPMASVIAEAYAFLSAGPIYLFPDESFADVRLPGFLEAAGLGATAVFFGEDQAGAQWVSDHREEISTARNTAFWGGILAPVVLGGLGVLLVLPTRQPREPDPH